ncbi:Low specificity L-threonine aldolase [compost metagenome]|uniref:Aminotransferase class I/II-fold pyridoxal phosphate-dependent enzyme n=1 Tax=Sphingobacterium paramultivorum TaxID=2886510 RepID=A0A7G5E0F1_9SPHI|nr:MULTISPECIES: aminotransferase class I/II-fold pyridoxal phosphate-dependent enzyme [Sphingobacterium]MCS4164645.1 threonine aldolase [Sphingobacterium sp. BIGb0116]QMV67476.1 aminotransferase class I/II-fold pyridoxal phosphate-dependent enzyme [Sphingobacterium paramultivorum]WSO16344.1 aminotransferase class I/II-fold pyridoxal phosphate-dependent enzyme [Sphingobacterium paramultivorum]
MYNFKNDYSEGAHPRILDKLIETNLIQQLGYGEDDYSKEAKSILKKKIANQQAVIHFLSGGTQTNLLVISFLLRIHEAVISAKTGHISANETGAIEATGHKVITVETSDGKLTPNDVTTVLKEHALAPHVVKPRIVYISNSTEIGTIYSLAELEALYVCCQQQQLLLYLDGARLGHALTAENNDLTFAAIAKYTDVFYIGGTKNGALLGEAVVFNRPELAVDFDYAIKQKGALLAKGRVLSIQFLTLFQDDLYLELALRANSLAMRMAKAIKDKGYSFLTESTTNQIFPILPKSVIEALLINYQFYIWKDIDSDYAAVRLITSWATDEKQVTNFINDILNS